MGFPYMFLVSTGALQAIPEDLQEAARIDGASGSKDFTQDHLPVAAGDGGAAAGGDLRLQLQQLRAIYLLTEGGPFSPDNPTAGGTDILISYTYRLAFGAGGAQIGFASAVSVVLFVVTGSSPRSSSAPPVRLRM